MKRAATSSPKGRPQNKFNRNKFVEDMGKSKFCDLQNPEDLAAIDVMCEFKSRKDRDEDGVIELYQAKFETMPGSFASFCSRLMNVEINNRDDWKRMERRRETWIHSSDSSDTSDDE